MLPEHMSVMADVLKADSAKAAHMDEKIRNAAIKALEWKDTHDPNVLEARVDGGRYHLIRVDSRSRVRNQRFRWRSVWIPTRGDKPARELALERRQEWAKAAAEAHNERRS